MIWANYYLGSLKILLRGFRLFKIKLVFVGASIYTSIYVNKNHRSPKVPIWEKRALSDMYGDILFVEKK